MNYYEIELNGELLALDHALQLDLVVAGAVGRQQRARVLEVLGQRAALTPPPEAEFFWFRLFQIRKFITRAGHVSVS